MSRRSHSFLRRELRRRPFFWFASVLLAFTVGAVATVQGCAFNAPYGSSGTGGSYSTSYATGGVGGGDAAVDVMADSPIPPAKLDYSMLCGDGCKPGMAASCTTTGQGGANSSSSSTSAGSTTASTSTSASTGSSSGSMASSGSSNTSTGSSSTASGQAPLNVPGCQVSADGASPFGVCAPTGHSAIDGPCQSAADCAPGLGCVANSGAGHCLPYCCGSLEACGKGTFCTPMPMAERPDRVIPVCTPVTPCQLFTHNCVSGETCTIVRADGTTSCVPKGSSGLCMPCPCADGFVCSATGECQELCHTTPSNECPSGSTCQGGSTKLPSGVGICVGGAADCMPQ